MHFSHLMHHSWYNFWDWIPPGWHHVVKSAGDGFRQKMSAKRKQCWAVSSAIYKHVGLCEGGGKKKVNCTIFQLWMKSTELRTLETRSFRPDKNHLKSILPWWSQLEGRGWKRTMCKVALIWPRLIFYTLVSCCLPRPQVCFPSALTNHSNLSDDGNHRNIWMNDSKLFPEGRKGVFLEWCWWGPELSLLGIFSVVLCNKNFYLCSHCGDLDYPALKKSNLIHSPPLRLFQVHNVWAIERCRLNSGRIKKNSGRLQHRRWPVFWGTRVTSKPPRFPVRGAALLCRCCSWGFFLLTNANVRSHRDHMTRRGVNLAENGSNGRKETPRFRSASPQHHAQQTERCGV